MAVNHCTPDVDIWAWDNCLLPTILPDIRPLILAHWSHLTYNTLPSLKEPINEHSYVYDGTVGSPDIFGELAEIVVDSTGKYFCVDAKKACVQVLSNTGIFERSIGCEGSGEDAAQFLVPVAIAINHDGDLVIVDTVQDKIKIFSRSGQFKLQFPEPGFLLYPNGVAITIDGSIVVTDDKNVLLFSPLGDHLGEIDLNQGTLSHDYRNPTGVAVFENGDIAVAVNSIDAILIFDPTGQTRIRTMNNVPPSPGGILRGIAVDKQGKILAADVAYQKVCVWHRDGRYLRCDTGDWEHEHVQNDANVGQKPTIHVERINGVAIHPITRNILVLDGGKNVIHVFKEC